MGLGDWFVRSSTALHVDRALAWIEGIAGAIAALVIIASFVAARPLSGIQSLLLPAIPLLLIGQLWIIGILNARFPHPRGNWWSRWKGQVRAQMNSRKLLFGALPGWASYGLLTAAVICWLAAMTSFLSLSQGGPIGGMAGCRWPLQNHGDVTCVSEQTYEDARRAEERLVAGILMFFFVFHAGVAANEVMRRRSEPAAI